MTENRLILERNQHLEKGIERSELPAYCSFWPEGRLQPTICKATKTQTKNLLSFWPEEAVDRMQGNQNPWKVKGEYWKG